MVTNGATLWEKFLLLFCKKRESRDIGKYCTAVTTFKILHGKLFIIKAETKENAKN